MIKTLLRYVGEYKKVSTLTPIFTALEVIMEILIPFIIASIIDKGISAGNMQNVLIYGALMLFVAFLSLYFGIKAGRFASTASTGFAANIREGLFKNIQTFSFSNIDKYSTAGLVTRMTTDVTNLQNAYQMCLRIAVRAPLMLICSMVMCFFINARLSLIFLVALIFLGCILFGIAMKVMPIFKKVFNRYDELNASVQENVAAIRVVKSYVREDYEDKKFSTAAEKLYKMFVKAESILALNNPIMMFVIYGCVIALSWGGAHYIVGGTMSTGNLTSLFSYVISMMMSLMMLSMIFVMLSMSVASAARISEVLSERPDITNPENPIEEAQDGSIEFRDVNFSYKQGSGENVLSNINLKIKSGETIGIIGSTGSGKSSFVNLISRLYDVTSGEVLVGGHNVKEYDLEALRNQVAVVLQKNVLFSGTILENLRWGREGTSESECIEACKEAAADEFIQRFPDAYNTWIEQGGSNLSGGQRQRLCIARALLKNPKILILDDSTSAVDTATDEKIRKAFKDHIPGTTKLIISQRISSIQNSDRIIVLDGGQVIGFDTHENLLESNELYKEIYSAQIQGSGDFDEKEKEGK